MFKYLTCIYIITSIDMLFSALPNYTIYYNICQ
nr:MAG TPA: hypothetical protein [Bacteriophage sp.]